MQSLSGISYLWRFDEPFDGLGQDEEGDEQQEQTVDEAGQHFGADVAVGEALVRLPLGDDGGGQASQQTRAVEEHVERVGD